MEETASGECASRRSVRPNPGIPEKKGTPDPLRPEERCSVVIGEQHGERVICGAVREIHGPGLGRIAGHDFRAGRRLLKDADALSAAESEVEHPATLRDRIARALYEYVHRNIEHAPWERYAEAVPRSPHHDAADAVLDALAQSAGGDTDG